MWRGRFILAKEDDDKMKMPKMMSKVRFPILLASRVFFLDDAVTAFNLKPPINHIKEVAE